MRKFLLCVTAVLLATATHAYASNVGFSIGINLGYPAPAAPVYVPQPAVIDDPPEFVAPPELGFYVAVGVPYDLFYLDDAYYLCRGNVWYTSPYYDGPWETVYYNQIPYALHRYPFARIHQYRDYYFRRYHDYADWRGYQHFRPGWHGMEREGRGWGRPAYNTPNRPNQGNWNSPVYNVPGRPVQGNWNRSTYSTPTRQVQGSWNRPSYNSPARPASGPWGRPVYNTPNRQVQGNWNRPAYNASRTYDRGNAGRQVNYSPNRNEHGNWRTQGHDR